MAKHPWPFDFPRHARPGEDLNAQDLYELIIHAVATGGQESNRISRVSTGSGGRSADAVAASLRAGGADILRG